MAKGVWYTFYFNPKGEYGMEKREHYCCGDDDCCAVQEVPNPSFMARLDRLDQTLCEANQIINELVGQPEEKQDSVGKDPNSIAEAISIRLWALQYRAGRMVIQLERLREIMV